MKHVTLYTDGGCRGNPGPGAWAAVLSYDQHQKQLTGFAADTTNNQMELMAAINGLAALKEGCQVDLYTDSSYVKNGIEQWLEGWKKKNWRTANKKPVKNQALWQDLDQQNQRHNVTWHWVKGHNGDPGNELADQLCNDTMDEHLK